MCSVHYERAILKSIKQKDRAEIAKKLKGAFEDQSRLQELAMELSKRG